MSYDPTDPFEQEAAREEAKKKADLAEKQAADDIKWLMTSKRGRRIVFRILRRAGVWQSSFNTNALQMAFNEGRRSEGTSFAVLVEFATPEHYNLMIQESKDD
jgi:hypothetical protein